MNKLGKFAAAGAAVVCAFGASAAAIDKFVEYVQTSGSGGSGSQYVLLDYTPTSASVVEAEIAVANPTTFNQCVFCARGNDTATDSFTLFWLGDGFRWDYETVNSAYEGKNKFVSNSKVSVKCSNSGFWMNGTKSTSVNVSPKDYTPANKMMLFASYTCQPSATPAATGNYAAMKLYSFKAYDNNGETLCVDLWPCVDTDGKAGLYDTVTDKIYYSKGTSALAASTTEVQGPITKSRLMISGSPRPFGDVSPSYGGTNGLAVGETFICSAPVAWTNVDETAEYDCVGYKVYTNGVVYVEGEENSFVYKHPDCETGAEIVWQWNAVDLLRPVYSCELTVGGYTGSTELENFPLLVRISESRISGFSYLQVASPEDISFADASGDLLPYEVENWNPSGESCVWVRVPKLSGTATKVTMRWQHAKPVPNDPQSVWSAASFKAVWHMNEDATNQTDSTSSGYNIKMSPTATHRTDTGMAGIALYKTASLVAPNPFDAANAGLSSGSYTVSGWYYWPDDASSTQYTHPFLLGSSGADSWYTEHNYSTTQLQLIVNNSGKGKFETGVNTSKAWSFFTLTWNGSTCTIYINGVNKQSGNWGLKPGTANLSLGNFKGWVDETRLRSACSSADWVKAEYGTASNPDFVTAGKVSVANAAVIIVGSSSGRYGAVSPDYGTILNPEVGKEYVFACPEEPVVIEADAERFVCTGWSLFDIASGALLKSSADEGMSRYECRHVYEDGKGVNLVWQWQREFCVTVKAVNAAGAEVSSVNTWLAPGTVMTIEAPQVEGETFASWSGDTMGISVFQPTFDRIITAPNTLVAKYVAGDPEIVDNTYAGETDGLWNVDGNWSLGHVPTAYETAVVPTGKGTIVISNAAVCANLVIQSGVKVSLIGYEGVADNHPRFDVRGDVEIAGNGLRLGNGVASVYQPLFNVGGTLTLNDSGVVEAYAGEGLETTPDWRAFKRGGAAVSAGALVLNGTSKLLVHAAKANGLPVVCSVTGDVTVAEGARIAGSNYVEDRNCYGWGWEAPKGLGYDSAGKGGAYGGNGGNGNSKTYGWKYAPFYPGSPGSYRSDSRGQGGGAVRIAAGGKVTLNGKIYVTGGHNENMSNHAGSGGGVWITCAEFVPGEKAVIHARGGRSNQHGSAYAGGGGRVAIMTGSPSEAQINSLYETGTCEDLLVSEEDMNDSAAQWPKLVNVKGGENNDNAANATYYGHGKPGTAVLLKNSYGQSVVTIGGNVPTMETTPAYGTTSVDRGEQTFTAPQYIYTEDGLSRYECLGWEWEDTKGNSNSGETLSATVDVQADIAFTWKWSGIQRKLTARSGGYGSVAWDGGEWYDDGTVVSLTAVPAADCAFVCWAGEFDYANEANKNAALTLTMDRPREVVALFQGAEPRTLTWNAGGTSDWFDQANWDGEAVPSELDSVVFAGGTFVVKFPFEIKVANWTQGGGTVGYVGTKTSAKSNSFNDNTVNYVEPIDAADTRFYSLAVAGDMTLNGKSTKLWFGGLNAAVRHDVTVGGNFAMADSAAFELYAGGPADLADPSTFAAGGAKLKVGGDLTLEGSAVFYPCCHLETGAPVVMDVARLVTIGEKATINANVRGFGRRVWNPGTGWYSKYFGPGAATSDTLTGEPDRRGGTYGGLGGRVSASLFPDGVGYLLAPYLPGSAGIVRPSYGEIFSAGGAVRIIAHKIVLNGTITANGDGQYCRAAGSGGGVWLTSHKFELGAKGKIYAKGGSGYGYGATGGGGGGRIAVMVKANAGQIEKLYATGVLKGGEVSNLADLPDWEGHFDVAGGIGGESKDVGQPGTAVFVTAPTGFSLIVR